MKVNSLLKSTIVLGTLFVAVVLTPARAEDDAAFDVRPVPVKTPPPSFPSDLRRDGVSGMVAVKVLVDENGNVSECAVTKSSHAEFEAPALAAVRNWKFKPASKGGAPVKAKLIIPIKFEASEA
jgi:periplasmic protein TonB